MNNPNQAPKNIIIEGNYSQIHDFSLKFPQHIRKLLNTSKEFREDSYKLSLFLSKFSYLTEKDETLNEIYSKFNWDPIEKTFKSEITYEEFVNAVQESYQINSLENGNDERKIERLKESPEDILFNQGFIQHFARNEKVVKNVIMNSYDSNFDNNFTDFFLSNSAKAFYCTNRHASLDESSVLSHWEREKTNPLNNVFSNQNNILIFKGDEGRRINENSNKNSIFSLRNIDTRKKSTETYLNKKKKTKSIIIKDEQKNSKKNNSSLTYNTLNTDTLNNIRSYGLKHISKWVKEIVKDKNKTNYKEISDIIVDKFKNSDRKNVNSKEEKNIRRRIYDSLNVMKALKLFKNEKNKTIMWNEEFQDQDEECDLAEIGHDKPGPDNNELNIDNIDRKIKEKRRNLEKLNNEISKIEVQKRVLGQFIQRNKNVTKDACDESERIYFPFILIEFPESRNNSISIVSNEDKSKLHLAFKEPIDIYGDLDLIMKLHQKSCDKGFGFN